MPKEVKSKMKLKVGLAVPKLFFFFIKAIF